MTKKNKKDVNQEIDSEDKGNKIQSLRDMINNAERTIQSAKAMLLQLEGKKKTGRKRKVEEADGTIVEGTFDGQLMNGADGKQYPVPANYASKSKLVEGDMLKLTITTDGSFIYKQIGPAARKNAIGIVSQDESGNYYVIAEGKAHKVLLASITYFRAEPGDEVAIVVPRDIESSWCAIENVTQKAKEKNFGYAGSDEASDEPERINKSAVDEWSSEIDELEKELKAEENASQQ